VCPPASGIYHPDLDALCTCIMPVGRGFDRFAPPSYDAHRIPLLAAMPLLLFAVGKSCGDCLNLFGKITFERHFAI